MDFTLDTEQKALRDAIGDMVGRWTPDEEVGLVHQDPDQWKELAEMGVLFEEGIGPVEEMIIAEELGRARVRSAYSDALLAGHVLAAVKHPLLSSVQDGSAFVVPALNEKGRAWSLTSTVKADGDKLTGVLGPVPFGDTATHVVVNTDAGLYLLEGPAVEGNVITLDGTAAEKLTDDPQVLVEAVNIATSALLAEGLGAMQAATDLTVDYLKTRKQFGVPLAAFQALTFRAADLYVAVELFRSIVQYAAMTVAEDPSDSATVSRAKVVFGRTGRLVGQEAIQLHGGIGMTAEYSVGHYTSRLTAIERTWGDTRQHTAALAATIGDHEDVDLYA